MTSKFKVGDRVRFVDCVHSDSGTGVIEEIDGSPHPYVVRPDAPRRGHECWTRGYFCDDELTLLASASPSASDHATRKGQPVTRGVLDYHDKKHDQGKSRMDLLPFAALFEVGRVLAYGCEKYAEDSWQTLPDARKRYTAALLRHLSAMQDGESHDPESQFPHAAHVATNALFILWLVLRGR